MSAVARWFPASGVLVAVAFALTGHLTSTAPRGRPGSCGCRSCMSASCRLDLLLRADLDPGGGLTLSIELITAES